MPAARQRLRLLAAAAEDERVAALQAHDVAPGERVLDEQPRRLLLRHLLAAADLADVDHLGVRRARPRAPRSGSAGRGGSRRRAAMSSIARAVSRPGSPGPAPTSYTVPGAPLIARGPRPRPPRAGAARPPRRAPRGRSRAPRRAPTAAVGRADERPQHEPVAVAGDRVGAHRRVAVGVEGADERALGRQRARGRGVGERLDGGAAPRVAGPDRDRERALARGRDQLVERPGRLGAAAEALQPGERRARSRRSRRRRAGRRRVSTLPRSSTTSRSPRSARSCAARRSELVPTRAPVRRASASAGGAAQRVARVGPRRHRGDDDARPRSFAGTSLAECTARSTSPSEQRARRARAPSAPCRRGRGRGRPTS